MGGSSGPPNVRFSISITPLKDSLTTLGRFAADYDSSKTISSSPAPDILCFAQQKLLCAAPDTRNMPSEGILACLSVLFALEFDPSTPDAYYIETTLVERHLRHCLGASHGFESLRTAAGSEPFVAKAAAELIRGSGSTSVEHLEYHEYRRCIDCDGRGVLPASLLVMQARDIVMY